MPKQVDHEVRRRQMTDALCRITIKGGLGSVSFREVAQEAGVSVPMVQYYFGTKEELLLAAFQHLADRVTIRMLAAIDGAGPDAPIRTIIQIAVDQFLPLDPDRHDEALLFVAFHTASLTDVSLARAEARAIPGSMTEFLRGQLGEAARRKQLAKGVDPEHDGALLVTIIIGLAHMMLSGTYSPSEGALAARHAVDRLFR